MAHADAHPNAGNGITLRLKLYGQVGIFAKVTQTIADCGGSLGTIEIIETLNHALIRDIAINTTGQEQNQRIIEAVKALPNVEFIHTLDRTFEAHRGGKIEIKNKLPLRTRDDLSMAYTPGVARICQEIAEKPNSLYQWTIKKNTVCVVSDGTAILGLGDLGPGAALPVMEGKAMLFKQFANIDAFPICLDTKDTEEIIRTIKAIAPVFGGFNLEDISAPRCFEIEERLKAELDIPIFHDDQHGTAVVTTAALINALKVVGKKPENLKVAMLGAGAAGTACAKMMMALGVQNIILCDRHGAIHSKRDDLNSAKLWLAENTNPHGESGSIHEVLRGADVFLGVSGPRMVTAEDMQKMAKDAIVFAMANPTPEIMPEEALPYVAVMATGRSDYPNQINNVLCFPGIFRGALDCMARTINEEMKMAAARAIAETVDEAHLNSEYIIPSAFDGNVVPKVAAAVREAAIASGVARVNLL